MFPGDSLYAESEVLEKRESASKPDRGIVAVETRGFNQNKAARHRASPPISGAAKRRQQ